MIRNEELENLLKGMSKKEIEQIIEKRCIDEKSDPVELIRAIFIGSPIPGEVYRRLAIVLQIIKLLDKGILVDPKAQKVIEFLNHEVNSHILAFPTSLARRLRRHLLHRLCRSHSFKSPRHLINRQIMRIPSQMPRNSKSCAVTSLSKQRDIRYSFLLFTILTGFQEPPIKTMLLTDLLAALGLPLPLFTSPVSYATLFYLQINSRKLQKKLSGIYISIKGK